LLYESKLLQHVDYPVAEALGAGCDEIKMLIANRGRNMDTRAAASTLKFVA
jgi:hypothetical protein